MSYLCHEQTTLHMTINVTFMVQKKLQARHMLAKSCKLSSPISIFVSSFLKLGDRHKTRNVKKTRKLKKNVGFVRQQHFFFFFAKYKL